MDVLSDSPPPTARPRDPARPEPRYVGSRPHIARELAARSGDRGSVSPHGTVLVVDHTTLNHEGLLAALAREPVPEAPAVVVDLVPLGLAAGGRLAAEVQRSRSLTRERFAATAVRTLEVRAARTVEDLHGDLAAALAHGVVCALEDAPPPVFATARDAVEGLLDELQRPDAGDRVREVHGRRTTWEWIAATAGSATGVDVRVERMPAEDLVDLWAAAGVPPEAARRLCDLRRIAAADPAPLTDDDPGAAALDDRLTTALRRTCTDLLRTAPVPA